MKHPSRIALSIIAVGSAAATCVFAAVQPLIITLTGTSKSYTVPSGKVLVIENAYSGNDWSNNQAVVLKYGTFTNVVYVDNWFKKITPIQPSLKITEDWVIEARLETSDEHYVMLFCLLVDPEDLYAAMQNEFEFVSNTPTDFEATLHTASPRQAVIEVEQSGNLVDWNAAMQAAISPKETKTDHTIALSNDLDRIAIRTRVLSRTGSGGIKKN